MPFSILELEVETPQEAEEVADLMEYEVSERVPPSYTVWGAQLRGRVIRYMHSLGYTPTGFVGNAYVPYLALNYFDRFASVYGAGIEGLLHAHICQIVDECIILALECIIDLPISSTSPLQDRIIRDLGNSLNPVSPFSYVKYLLRRVETMMSSSHHQLFFHIFHENLKMLSWNIIKTALNDIRVLKYRPIVLAVSVVLKQCVSVPSYPRIKRLLLQEIARLQARFMEDENDSDVDLEDNDLEDADMQGMKPLEDEVDSCSTLLRFC